MNPNAENTAPRKLSVLNRAEVVATLGVVSALLTALSIAFWPRIIKGRTETTCAGNLKQVAQAYNLYQNDNEGAWPYHGGVVENPYVWAMYKPPIFCPVDRSRYTDSYSQGRWALQHPELKVRNTLTDGRTIPRFDPEVDVLARCLRHGIEGFSKGSNLMWVRDEKHLKGRVLGVRADGAVNYMAPVSCWEVYDEKYEAPFKLFSRHCDLPASSGRSN